MCVFFIVAQVVLNVSSLLVCSFSFKCFDFCIDFFSCSVIAVNGSYVSRTDDVLLTILKNSQSQKVA